MRTVHALDLVRRVKLFDKLRETPCIHTVGACVRSMVVVDFGCFDRRNRKRTTFVQSECCTLIAPLPFSHGRSKVTVPRPCTHRTTTDHCRCAAQYRKCSDIRIMWLTTATASQNYLFRLHLQYCVCEVRYA